MSKSTIIVMRTKPFISILLAILVCIAHNVYGQGDSTKQLSKKEIEEIISKALKADTIGKSRVGELILTENQITVKTIDDSKSRLYYAKINQNLRSEGSKFDTIEKVIIDIREGRIADIQVITKNNRIFTNWKAPIDLNSLGESRCDLLRSIGPKGNEYINICEFLQHIRHGRFTPEEKEIELKTKGDKVTLYKSVGLNSIIDLRLFTDLLGVFGEESNGLIQTEAYFKSPLNSKNLRNRNLTPLKHVEITFVASKFDENYKYTSFDSNYSRSTLNQRSWLSTEFGLNILEGFAQAKSNSSVHIDAIAGFQLANIAFDTDSSTVSMSHFGFSIGLETKIAQNIFFQVTSPLIWQNVEKLKQHGEGGFEKIFSPNFVLSWNPVGDPSSRIFSRVKYVNIHDEESPYWLVQFGYSLSLSGMVKQ